MKDSFILLRENMSDYDILLLSIFAQITLYLLNKSCFIACFNIYDLYLYTHLGLFVVRILSVLVIWWHSGSFRYIVRSMFWNNSLWSNVVTISNDRIPHYRMNSIHLYTIRSWFCYSLSCMYLVHFWFHVYLIWGHSY